MHMTYCISYVATIYTVKNLFIKVFKKKRRWVPAPLIILFVLQIDVCGT